MTGNDHPKSIDAGSIDAGDLPLSISPADSAPAYQQLAEQLRQLIETRVLRPGTRLPSSRALALALGVNRNTVVAAFDHLLNSGFLQTHGRRGTVIANVPQQTLAKRFGPAPARTRTVTGQSTQSPCEPIDFRLGAADPSPLPIEVWRRACREAGRHLPRPDYGDPRGDQELRTQIALYLGRTRALRVESDQIVVTAGAGQALERIAEATLGSGDHAALEEPGYPRAARAFSRLGAHLMPIPVDADGMRTDFVGMQKEAPRLIHVTPSHQYPLGARLSSSRRGALVQWARERHVLVIENDYDGEFRYGSAPLPTLAALAGFEQVAYLGTFSKVLSPALRLGFMVAGQDLVERVAATIAHTHDPVSTVIQRIVSWLIRTGELEGHIRRSRRQYAARRDAMLEALGKVPAVASIDGQAAGLHVVLTLRQEAVNRISTPRLEQGGVSIDRVSDFCVRGQEDHRLLLAYGHLTEAQIAQGVARLGTLISRG